MDISGVGTVPALVIPASTRTRRGSGGISSNSFILDLDIVAYHRLDGSAGRYMAKGRGHMYAGNGAVSTVRSAIYDHQFLGDILDEGAGVIGAEGSYLFDLMNRVVSMESRYYGRTSIFIRLPVFFLGNLGLRRASDIHSFWRFLGYRSTGYFRCGSAGRMLD